MDKAVKGLSHYPVELKEEFVSKHISQGTKKFNFPACPSGKL